MNEINTVNQLQLNNLPT